MLVEKNKDKYKRGCVKMGIILAGIIFLIWSGLFIVLIFAFFIFFGGNKKTNINFTKVLESIGVYDCTKYFFGDYDRKDGNDKRNKGVIINNYLEKINKSIKKRAEELKKKEQYIEQIKNNSFEKKIDKLESLSKIKEKVKEKENTEILWERPKIEKYKKEKKNIFTKTINKPKNKPKYEHSSFSNGKSIWDDYESVIDIMNKNK